VTQDNVGEREGKERGEEARDPREIGHHGRSRALDRLHQGDGKRGQQGNDRPRDQHPDAPPLVRVGEAAVAEYQRREAAQQVQQVHRRQPQHVL